MRKMFSKNQINEMINNEVESALEDLTIEASNIDSGEATSGQVLTANGSGGASFQNAPKELPETLGTAGQVLKVNAGRTGVEWANDNEGMSNPMTTSNDIIVGGASGTPTRLSKGSNGELLGVNASGNVAYTKSLPVLTSAPTQDNTDGGIIIVVLSSEPVDKYDGYLYLITGA